MRRREIWMEVGSAVKMSNCTGKIAAIVEAVVGGSVADLVGMPAGRYVMKLYVQHTGRADAYPYNPQDVDSINPLLQ